MENNDNKVIGKDGSIRLMSGRITDEYRKHGAHIDGWAEIAARKIYSQWSEFYQSESNHLNARVKELGGFFGCRPATVTI